MSRTTPEHELFARLGELDEWLRSADNSDLSLAPLRFKNFGDNTAVRSTEHRISTPTRPDCGEQLWVATDHLGRSQPLQIQTRLVRDGVTEAEALRQPGSVLDLHLREGVHCTAPLIDCLKPIAAEQPLAFLPVDHVQHHGVSILGLIEALPGDWMGRLRRWRARRSGDV